MSNNDRSQDNKGNSYNPASADHVGAAFMPGPFLGAGAPAGAPPGSGNNENADSIYRIQPHPNPSDSSSGNPSGYNPSSADHIGGAFMPGPFMASGNNDTAFEQANIRKQQEKDKQQ
ncbi:hypothetical protein K7432_017128 [Basidiobolus ranarum]|uniref:Uncharacterized protein n=1 Tax=Basidiobolus ranarum TaxID=34480 RepID=A0ABR2VKR3_9FUNG